MSGFELVCGAFAIWFVSLVAKISYDEYSEYAAREKRMRDLKHQVDSKEIF